MLKTGLLLETDGERRVLAQKLYHRLARTRAIGKYTEILKPRLATNPERVFIKH